MLSTSCSKCGGSLRIKNHQRWIGYYCPSCKSGGSMPKKPGKWAGKKFTPHIFKKRNNQKPSAIVTNPDRYSYVISTKDLAWHGNTNTFTIDASSIQVLKYAPYNISGKEYFMIVNDKTLNQRTFFKVRDKFDSEGELQYTEYQHINQLGGNIIKLKIYND